jgi:hypothetical protein
MVQIIGIWFSFSAFIYYTLIAESFEKIPKFIADTYLSVDQ